MIEGVEMAAIAEPEPVKLFAAVLWSDEPTRRSACAAMEQHWGVIDFVGADHPFDATNFYEPEMGPRLQRRLVAFSRLVSPEILASAKLACIEIEAVQSEAGKRRVNLDVGYLDHNKIVLASVKGLGQKIYLSKGIYADLVARYGHGRYQPFEWTFPDFKTGRCDADLAQLRQIYLNQMKAHRRQSD